MAEEKSPGSACSHQFKWKNASLSHGSAVHLQTSQWPGWLPYFMTYRFASTAGILGWLIFDFYTEADTYASLYLHPTRGRYELWFLFPVNWCFLLVAISALFHCWLCTKQIMTRKNQKDVTEEKIGVTGAIYWLTFNISSNLTVVDLVFYVTWVWHCQETCDYSTSNQVILKHSLLPVYVLLDAMLVATPFRLLHVIYPFCTLVLYLVINVILNVYAKIPVTIWQLYPNIPWYDLDLTVIMVTFALLSVLVTQSLLTLVGHGRVMLARQVTSVQMPALLQTSDDVNYDPYIYSSSTKRTDQKIYLDSTRELYRGSLPRTSSSNDY